MIVKTKKWEKPIFDAAYEMAKEIGVKKTTTYKIGRKLGICNAQFYGVFYSVDTLKDLIFKKAVEDLEYSIIIEGILDRTLVFSGLSPEIQEKLKEILFV